jgi:hypothetical protein
MLAFRSVVSVLVRFVVRTSLQSLKAGLRAAASAAVLGRQDLGEFQGRPYCRSRTTAALP